MSKRFSVEEWISKARLVHGDKYDYSKFTGYKAGIPVEIICPTHGSFFKLIGNHLAGQGCPMCSRGISSAVMVADNNQSMIDACNVNLSALRDECIKQLPETIISKTSIFWLKGEDVGIICISIRKTAHSCYNYFFIKNEFQSAIDCILSRKIDGKVWCSNSPVIANKFSRRAFDALIEYCKKKYNL
jgi:hypothetical protein